MPKLNITPATIIDLIRQMDVKDIEWLVRDIDKLVNNTEMAISLAKYFAEETKYIRSLRPDIHESFMRYVKLED